MITKEQIQKDPGLSALLAMMESKTTKDKHDLILVKFGNLVASQELAERENGRAGSA